MKSSTIFYGLSFLAAMAQSASVVEVQGSGKCPDFGICFQCSPSKSVCVPRYFSVQAAKASCNTQTGATCVAAVNRVENKLDSAKVKAISCPFGQRCELCGPFGPRGSSVCTSEPLLPLSTLQFLCSRTNDHCL